MRFILLVMIILYFELYSRTAGGIETQIGADSEMSPILTTTSSQILLHLNITEQTVINATDRIVIKIYGDTSGAGGDPTVTIYMEGADDCRFGVLTTSTAFAMRSVLPCEASWSARTPQR